MKAPAFNYQRATSVDSALQLLAKGEEGAKLLGGGQSLGPMMNLRLVRTPLLIDVSNLADVEQPAHDGYWIKGTTTHAAIEDGQLDALFQQHPPLASMFRLVARGIAYRAVRNSGTVAGTLVHADPAGDWILALMALGGRVACRSTSETRLVPMARFMLAAYTSALADNELATGVVVPEYSIAMRWGYYKFCRKPGEFAEASCACVFDPDKGVARVAIGALSGPPVLLTQLAEDVARRGARAVTDGAIRESIEATLPGRDAYENRLTVNAIKRSLTQALGAQDE